MATLLWILLEDSARQWFSPSQVGVQIRDELYLVPKRRFARLAQSQPTWLSTAEERARLRLEKSLHHELDKLFTVAHQRVPEFADWYYSPTGVVVRLWSTIPWIQLDITGRLFPEEEWNTNLDLLDGTIRELYGEEIDGFQERWLAWLVEELAPYRHTRSSPVQQETIDVIANLRASLEPHFTDTHLPYVFTTGPVAANVALRQVNARVAASRAAARLAGRSTAVGSSTVCGASGPAALGCAAIVFTGITLGTEWLILKGDEVLHRTNLEQALHCSVEELRKSLMDEYMKQLAPAIKEDLSDLAIRMQDSLRPIDSVRTRP